MEDQDIKGNDSLQAQKEAKFEETMERLHDKAPVYPPFDPFYKRPRKNKIIAGLLAVIFPGIGHFYLGLMQRGLFMMLLLILDIYAIVHFAVGISGDTNIPLVTLFGLLVPVVYFYNIFDVLQSTDQVNKETTSIPMEAWDNEQPTTVEKQKKTNPLGWVLIVGGLLIFMISNKPSWLDTLLQSMGSYVGAILLIGAGVILFIKDSRK